MATIYTIGHGTKSQGELLDKLKKNDIQKLIDVRSIPYSRKNPQFNREELRSFLQPHGIEYVHKGKNLGGLSENVRFDETCDEVVALANAGWRVAVMCSESSPSQCHRKYDLQPEFENRGAQVLHIEWGRDDFQLTMML